MHGPMNVKSRESSNELNAVASIAYPVHFKQVA